MEICCVHQHTKNKKSVEELAFFQDSLEICDSMTVLFEDRASPDL